MQPYRMGELYTKRTHNSKTFINSDGTFTAEISSRDIHFEDEESKLRDINIELIDEMEMDKVDYPISKDIAKRFKAVKEAKQKGKMVDPNAYGFQSLCVPFDVRLSKKFDKGYTIGKNDTTLIFRPIGANGVVGQLIDKKTMKYINAWQDTDVELIISDIGIKENIIINSPSAQTTFTYEIGGKFSDLRKGELKLKDAWLVDASGVERDVEQQIRYTDTRAYVDLIADTTGLTYPITIDPTVTLSLPSDTLKNAWYYAGDTTTKGIGLRIQHSVGTGYRAYSYLQFNIPSTLQGLASNAQLSVYSISSNNNSNSYLMTMDAKQITSSWDENNITTTTHPTTNTVVSDATVSFSIDNSLSGFKTWRSLTVTTIVNDWINSGQTNYGFMLYGTYAAPSNYNGYCYFADRAYSDTTKVPKLTIVYNATPSAPTVTYPNGGETINAQHTITWNPSTDDTTVQTSLQYQIQLSTDNGVTYTDIIALTTAGVTSYTYDFSAKPATTTAKIRIRAYDGTLYGAYDESNAVFTIQHSKTKVRMSDGSWKIAKVKVWVNGAWKQAKVKVWTGSAWKSV